MTSSASSNPPQWSTRRSSDGRLLHPAHAQFHLLRLLVGSVIGGWTAILAFMSLGFLGSIEFLESMDLAIMWILIGGTIIGIILGLVLSIIAGLLVNIPYLRRNVHPLAIVRAGFMIAIVLPFAALSTWPSSMIGFVIAPIAALALAWLSLVSNRHADLVPHSTLGRLLGTAIGPFLIFAILLSILVPMLNRGFGIPSSPKLIVIALDGVDGPLMNQFLESERPDGRPNIRSLTRQGARGVLSSSEPLIPARMWADLMTGTSVEKHRVLDRYSSAADLSAMPIWEILSLNRYRVGLFQMLPLHPRAQQARFDVPPPETYGSSPDHPARIPGDSLLTGAGPELPSPWQISTKIYRLARLGVRLETITAVGREYVWEFLTRPDARLIYAERKLLEFQIETDRALAQLRTYPVDAAFLRFRSLEPLFLRYWRYSRPNEFGAPPEDIDSALATGLGRVIPDAYGCLDDLIAKLAPFRSEESILVVVSNHGVRSASTSRIQNLRLSADRLLEAAGWKDRVLADISGDGMCLRPVNPADGPESLEGLGEMLGDAVWTTNHEDGSSRRSSRPLVSVNMLTDCMYVTLVYATDLTGDVTVTMGEWSGPLSDLLAEGDSTSGKISDQGLFLIRGPHFYPGAVASPMLYDLVPTILHSLGLPVSDELDGQVVDGVFDPAWFSENPPRHVATYGRPTAPEEPTGRFPPSAQYGEPIEMSVSEPEDRLPEEAVPLEYVDL